MEFKKPREYIPFSPPWIGKAEEKEVLDTLRSAWITTGPKVSEFEKNFARYAGATHAVAAFSCTDAMFIALKALGIKDGDEIILSPYTFASTAHVICYHRAKPVFVDVEPDTFNINPNKIEEKITKKTKAIIPVHFAGHPCDMDPILKIAKKHNLYVMDDAAHAIGSEYNGRSIGSIGDITCFSFYATKNITTAEGGMAVTDNKEWASHMRILTMYGISDARQIWHKRHSKNSSIHYDIVELGYKCNMTDICAAMGLWQLEKIGMFNKMREKFAKIYDGAFRGHQGLEVPKIKKYAKTNRHLYPLLLNLDRLDIDRDRFVAALRDMNIGTSVLFKPLHLHSYYAKTFGYRYGDFPVAEKLFERVICLPVSPKIGRACVRKIAEGVLYLTDRHKQ